MFTLGIKFDHMTPQVRTQIIKDLIGFKNQPSMGQSGKMAVYYEGDSPELAAILQALQIQRSPLAAVAEQWVLYQTGVHALEAPDHAIDVVTRDLQIKVKDPGVLNPEGQNGFYLAPQGRVIAPTINLNRPMPSWYPGGPTPDVVWLWS